MTYCKRSNIMPPCACDPGPEAQDEFERSINRFVSVIYSLPLLHVPLHLPNARHALPGPPWPLLVAPTRSFLVARPYTPSQQTRLVRHLQRLAAIRDDLVPDYQTKRKRQPGSKKPRQYKRDRPILNSELCSGRIEVKYTVAFSTECKRSARRAGRKGRVQAYPCHP